jgi:hypothetical protein
MHTGLLLRTQQGVATQMDGQLLEKQGAQHTFTGEGLNRDLNQ